MSELKRCSKCRVEKPLSEFNKNKSREDGLRRYCKRCRKIYYQENKERINARTHKYYETHKEKITEYRVAHKKEKKEYCHQYNLEHREEIRKHNSIRRGLGYNPLNEYFEGADIHHINNIDVVFIPRKIHRKFNGRFSIGRHRDSILNYYGSIERMIKNNPIRKVSNV